MVGRKKSFYCGICGIDCPSRAALDDHMIDHKETKNKVICSTCTFPFDDQLHLERHILQTGHMQEATATPSKFQPIRCDRCNQDLEPSKYAEHRKFPSGQCCDANILTRKAEHNIKDLASNVNDLKYLLHSQTSHMQLPDHGPDNKQKEIPASSLGPVIETHATEDVDDNYCYVCRTPFPSQAKLSRHYLTCTPILPKDSSDKYDHKSKGRVARGDSEKLSKENEAPKLNQKHASLALPSQVTEAAQLTTSSSSSLRISNNGNLTKNGQILHAVDQQLVVPEPRVKHGKQFNISTSAPFIQKQNTTDQKQSDVTRQEKGTLSQMMKCNFNGCDRSFKSEAAFRIHQADAHSIGGKGLDLHGKDSWMLNQRTRENLKQLGLLRTVPPDRPSSKRPSRRSALASPPVSQLAQTRRSVLTPDLASARPSVGGPEELVQASGICEQIMRLVLQSHVLLHNTGTLTYGGIQWTRVGIAKQGDVPRIFDVLCHLPRYLQDSEYTPSPKAFSNDYDKCVYPVDEFEHSPDTSSSSQALGMIAISCAKIGMANGCEEIVKIAALDAVNGRILMNHLVCTDPTMAVKDWRPRVTGMSCFKDLEMARQDGFKILRGWKSARSALWKYVDKQTIILGHNVRSDLDALRMVHGRSVDIAKMVEKAANGPLSRQQLSLDVLCRDLKQITLTLDPKFGRDVLQNAFAIRELALWKVKNEDTLVKWAKQKSLDYQRLGSRALSKRK